MTPFSHLLEYSQRGSRSGSCNEARVRSPSRTALQGERVKQLADKMPPGMPGIRAGYVAENVYFIVAIFMIGSL